MSTVELTRLCAMERLMAREITQGQASSSGSHSDRLSASGGVSGRKGQPAYSPDAEDTKAIGAPIRNY